MMIKKKKIFTRVISQLTLACRLLAREERGYSKEARATNAPSTLSFPISKRYGNEILRSVDLMLQGTRKQTSGSKLKWEAGERKLWIR